jgi:hypothetical protein
VFLSARMRFRATSFTAHFVAATLTLGRRATMLCAPDQISISDMHALKYCRHL